MSATSERIVAYLAEQREAMLDFLARLVLAESPSDKPEAQAAPLGMMAEALHHLGYTIRLVPGRKSGGHLVAQAGNGRSAADSSHGRQLLIGHCDTVWPLGTLREMPLEIADDIVRGPGVFDMKGGLTQMLFALRALHALQLTPPLAPVVFVNSDEEIGTIESQAALCAWAQRVARAFVLEPALGLQGKIKTARKGVGRFDVTVKGRAAHAGLDPEAGVSAVLGLARVIEALFALNDLEHGVSVNVGTIAGGTQTNVIAAESRATVDVRVPTVEDAERLEAAILRLEAPLAGTTLHVTGGFNRPPLERTPRNQALWRQARALGAELSLSLEQAAAGGGSDGNFTSLYTATLDGLGAVGDGAHAVHEFLYIDKMIERAALLALLLLSP